MTASVVTPPELIEIHLNEAGQPVRLVVDGQEFPWFIGPGATVHFKPTDADLSTIDMTIFAKRIITLPAASEHEG